MFVNINAWVRKTDAEKRKIRMKATAYVHYKALQVYNDAVKVSPQWSGEFAASWQITEVQTGHDPSPNYTIRNRDYNRDNWRMFEWWDIGKPPKNPSKPPARAAGMTLTKGYTYNEASDIFFDTPTSKFKRDVSGMSANEAVLSTRWNSRIGIYNTSASAPYAMNPRMRSMEEGEDFGDDVDSDGYNLRMVNLIAAPDGVKAYLQAKYSFVK